MNPARVGIRVRLDLVCREATLHSNIKPSTSHITIIKMIYNLKRAQGDYPGSPPSDKRKVKAMTYPYP